MQGASNVVFVVLTGLGTFLVALPLPKALASGNVGTSMLILWTELACLVQFVNAIRWNGNTENWAPAWCDICGYFLITVDVALAASGIAINRRLYLIVTLDPRRHEKAFNTAIDISLCLVFPCASIALQYVVQQYRFYIYEDIGCVSGVDTIDLSFPLVWVLPLFAGTVSAGYAWLAVRASLRRNCGLLGEERANSAWSRRLMAIGAVSTLYGLIPTSISIALLASAYPVTPWPGWRAVHSNINTIVYMPASKWRTGHIQIASVELRRWTIMTLAFVVFLLLGSTADVKKMYGAPFRSFSESIGRLSSRIVLDSERNPDGNPNDKKATRWSCFHRIHALAFGKQGPESRHDSFRLANGLRLDSDLEGFRLALPTSQSYIDTTKPHGAPWRLYYKGDDLHAQTRSGSSNHL